MAPDQASPLLSAVVVLPAAGALAVAVIARSKPALAPWLGALFAGITLVLATVVLFGGLGAAELYPWIPTLGVAFILENEGAGAALVGWVALATVITLVSTRPGARTTVLTLCLVAVANGLFLAGDVFLALACLGGAAAVVALLTTVPRSVLMFAAVGSMVLFGWFARVYQMVYQQTGFASTELARWRSLVLYPNEERALFVWGGLGVALLLPAFAIAVENTRAHRAHRLTLLTTAGTMGSVFIARIVVAICPGGAEASSSSVLALSVVLMAWAAIARGWTLLAVGYQGLVLYGMFSVHRGGASVMETMIVAASIGFFGLVVTSSRSLVWGFVLFLVAVPVAFILVPAWGAPTLWAWLGTLAFAMMVFGFVNVAMKTSPG